MALLNKALFWLLVASALLLSLSSYFLAPHQPPPRASTSQSRHQDRDTFDYGREGGGGDGTGTNEVVYASHAERLQGLIASGVRPRADEPRGPMTPLAAEWLHSNGTGPVALPARLIDTFRPKVAVITVGAGKYRRFALELLHSAAVFFCADRCERHLLLLTSKVDDLTDADLQPDPLFPRIVPAVVPFREWPQSTLNKCSDILEHFSSTLAQMDFVLFLDADTRFVAPVALEEVYGVLVGVEHPYYPRYARGFCGRYGNAPATNMHGFDDKGAWTFCQYPYHRGAESVAQIDLSLGKTPPVFDTGNSFYFQGALFGGTGPYFMYACDSIDKATKADTAQGHLASFHDESQLNAFLLRHMDITRVLNSSFIYPEPPLDKQFNFEWLFDNGIKPVVVHRVKDTNELRHDL